MAISRRVVIRVVIYGIALSIVGWQACDRFKRKSEADDAAGEAADKKKTPPTGRSIRLEDGTEVPILTPEEAAAQYGVEIPDDPEASPGAEPAEAEPEPGEVRINPAAVPPQGHVLK